MFNKKKSNKKNRPAANSRNKLPGQQPANRQPNAAGRQAPPPSRNGRPPVKQPVRPQEGNIPKNAPPKQVRNLSKNISKKPVSSGQPKPRVPTTPANAPGRNVPGSASGAVRKPAPKKAPKSVKKSEKTVRKTAPKPVKKVPTRTKGSISTAQSRKKYHGGNYILYYMLGGMLLIIVLAVLANTVLFRLNTITVSGNARYTSEEVSKCSMIEMGKNLLHINTRQAEENILSALTYLDAVKVKKSFPTGINISVTEADKRFYIRQGNITAAVSFGGRVIEHSPPNGMPVFSGYEPESVDVGAWLKSVTNGKNNIPDVILNAIDRASLENVDEIEMEDRFSIKMLIDGGRVILELGTIAQMESKLIVANKLIREEISPSERGTVLVSNPEQATFIPEKVSDMDEPDNPDNSDSSNTSLSE